MMKSWNSLTQQIEVWRQKHKYLSKVLGKQKIPPKDRSTYLNTSLGERKPHYQRPKSKRQYFFLLLLFAIISLTSIVGYRFYNQPQLTVGKISPVTIKAPRAGKFEDTKTTLEKRQEVQTGIVPILKQNENLTNFLNFLEIYTSRLEKEIVSTKPGGVLNAKLDQAKKTSSNYLYGFDCANTFLFPEDKNAFWLTTKTNVNDQNRDSGHEE